MTPLKHRKMKRRTRLGLEIKREIDGLNHKKLLFSIEKRKEEKGKKLANCSEDNFLRWSDTINVQP
jgi:hypothetical protein